MRKLEKSSTTLLPLNILLPKHDPSKTQLITSLSSVQLFTYWWTTVVHQYVISQEQSISYHLVHSYPACTYPARPMRIRANMGKMRLGTKSDLVSCWFPHQHQHHNLHAKAWLTMPPCPTYVHHNTATKRAKEL